MQTTSLKFLSHWKSCKCSQETASWSFVDARQTKCLRLEWKGINIFSPLASRIWLGELCGPLWAWGISAIKVYLCSICQDVMTIFRFYEHFWNMPFFPGISDDLFSTAASSKCHFERGYHNFVGHPIPEVLNTDCHWQRSRMTEASMCWVPMSQWVHECEWFYTSPFLLHHELSVVLFPSLLHASITGVGYRQTFAPWNNWPRRPLLLTGAFQIRDPKPTIKQWSWSYSTALISMDMVCAFINKTSAEV